MKPFLSLCMIVKNESKVIDRCLTSVSDSVDEIIIVDTGSTDNTVEIISNYDVKLLHYKWEDDFAAARNYAASHATGKWILVLDADEYVEQENLEKVKEMLKNNSLDVYAVSINNFTGPNGEHVVQNNHVRLYLNNNLYEYHRTIHEQIRRKDDKVLHVGDSGLNVYHTGYMPNIVKEKNKTQRNKRIIENRLRKEANGFDYFNYGNELRIENKLEEALDAYLKAYKLKENSQVDWVSVCLYGIAETLIQLDRIKEALEVIGDAKRLYYNTADFPYLEGQIYLAQGRYEEAKSILQDIANNTIRYHKVIKSTDNRDFHPAFNLAKIYENEENYSKAVHFYSLALNTNGKNIPSFRGLLRVLSKFHKQDEIFNLLHKKFHSNLLDDAFTKQIIYLSLNLGLSELAKQLVAVYISDREIVELISFKINMIGRATKNKIFLSTQNIARSMQLGILDIGDIYIISRESVYESEADLQKIVESSAIGFLLESELNIRADSEVYKNEIEQYTQLIIKCTRFNRMDLAHSLLQKSKSLPNEVYAQIGNILFAENFKDVAMSLYQLAPEETLTVADYLNIAKWLLDNNNKEEALRIAKEGIDRYEEDFRLYEFIYGLDILNIEDASLYMKKAKQAFPTIYQEIV